MKIFVAGVTGTLGRPVARLLCERGHEVVGLTRSADRLAAIEALGARAVIGDALDAQALRAAVLDARPHVIVHLLTALPPGGALRPRQLRPTNALRVVATTNLLRAAATARVHRLVAESFVAVYGANVGTRYLSEDDSLAPIASGPLRETLTALRSLEDQLRMARETASLETVALRIGFLYGPGVPSTELLIKQARDRRLFVPKEVSGVGSFVHISDAAVAIVTAIERPSLSPVYNVVDDEPASLATFLESLTQTIGAAPARALPAWFVRLAAPVPAEVASMRLLVANTRAKRELGWSPRYPTVQIGLASLAGHRTHNSARDASRSGQGPLENSCERASL